MQELPHTLGCFVCGEANPIGLKLRLHTDGHKVQTRFVPGPEHAGYKQAVHGGLISTLLDEVMSWACAVRCKRFGFSAELVVRFLHPARPHEELVATAEVVTNRRDKIFETKAELRNAQGTVLATATGKYMPIKLADAKIAATDLVGGLPEFLRG